MQRILLLILLLAFVRFGEAATWYVGKEGYGSGCCSTATNPAANQRCQTINRGISCMSSGDTLMIGAGVYDENITNADPGVAPGDFIGYVPNGISANQMTKIFAENKHQVILRMTPRIGGGDGYQNLFNLVSGRWIHLKGLYLDGQYHAFDGQPGVSSTRGMGLGGDEYLFEDIAINNVGTVIKEEGGPGEGKCVRNSTFLNMDVTKSGGGMGSFVCSAGIPPFPGLCHVFYGSSADGCWGPNTMDGGTFRDINGYFVQYSPGWTLKNITVDGLYNSIVVSSGYINVYNSTFRNIGGAGVLTGENSFVHNTFYSQFRDTGHSGGIEFQNWDIIKNNVFVDVNTPMTAHSGINSNHAGNVCDRASANCTVRSPSCWFVAPNNSNGGNLHPCTGSPLFGAGVATNSTYALDKDGANRPTGGGATVGAYQNSSGGALVLNAPTDLTLISSTITSTLSVTMGWTYVQGSDLATGFRKYRQPNCTGAFTQIGGTLPLSPLSFTESGIPLIASYCWRIVAVNAAGAESAPSNIVQWLSIPPAAPTLLQIVSTTITATLSANLAWTYVQGSEPAVAFHIYRQVNCTGTYALVGGNRPITPTTYTDSGIPLTNSQCWRVAAVNAVGTESTFSNIVQWNAPAAILGVGVKGGMPGFFRR